MTDVVVPPLVEPGDRVRLVSPASYPDRAWLDESIAILAGWGLVVEVGEHVLDEWGYLAGCDDDRAADLNAAFRDPGVRAVVTTRGGAGAYRIADRIDVDAVRRDPKPLVGFSDITYLHVVLWDRCRCPSIHGCLAGATGRPGLLPVLGTDSGAIAPDPCRERRRAWRSLPSQGFSARGRRT